MKKDSNCVFCKIVSGRLSCVKLYEDKDFLTFMDIKPISRGQSLVIPKAHYRWVDEVPDFGKYFEIAKMIGLASRQALNPVTIFYITLGFGVSHAHIRIIPSYGDLIESGAIDFEKSLNLSEEEIKRLGELIRAKLKTG